MPTPNPFRQIDGHSPDLVGPTREPWMDSALCAQADPDLFYDLSGERYEVKANGKRESAAKAVCGRCPVQGDCLEYALTHDERWGIWGGLNERERRSLRKGGAA